jgi:phage baseplate assembly protein gpV
VSRLVPLMEAVARREVHGMRTISLGVVVDVRSNDGTGERPSVDVRLHGTELVLHRAPVAQGRIGLSVLPRVGDLVVVAFVDGDLNGPIVLGSLYDDATEPPEAAPDQVVYEVADTDGDVRFEVRLPNGGTVSLADGGLTVDLGGTTVAVESGGGVTIEAAGDLTLKSNGSISIEAAATVDITGNGGASVSSSGTLELKGAINTIAGTTQFSAS